MNKNKRIIAAAKKVADTYGEEITGDVIREWIDMKGPEFGITTADADAVQHIAIEYIDEFGAINLDAELKKYYAHQ